MDAHASTHLLAAPVLLSRLADVLSTRLATPGLALEANALARRRALVIGIHGTTFSLRVHRDAALPANSHQQPT